MPSLEQYRSRVPIPSSTLNAPLERVFPHTFPIQENASWLHEYEQLEGSIFKYYNVPNEVKFLKGVENLPEEKKDFYLQENVKRFLGEFVGKIPYTTIPYEVDDGGMTYAGMHVRDSYQKAAEMGGEREVAEIQGFNQIEETYIISQLKKNGDAPTGVWISPPKIADYGFVFLFAPDANGKIKEYILRYPEKMSELKKSKDICLSLSPTLPPQTTDEFLTRPLFDRSKKDPKTILDSVMVQMNISPADIQKSHQFENAVDVKLSDWIRSYSDLIKSLALYEPGSPLYELGVIQAKKSLLAIYKKAEEMKREIDKQGEYDFVPTVLTSHNQLSIDELHYSAAALQKSGLPTADGGSCPAITDTETSPFTSRTTPPSNWEIFQGILSGKTPESLTVKERYDDYECPECGAQIRGEIVGSDPKTWVHKCPNPNCHHVFNCNK